MSTFEVGNSLKSTLKKKLAQITLHLCIELTVVFCDWRDRFIFWREEVFSFAYFFKKCVHFFPTTISFLEIKWINGNRMGGVCSEKIQRAVCLPHWFILNTTSCILSSWVSGHTPSQHPITFRTREVVHSILLSLGQRGKWLPMSPFHLHTAGFSPKGCCIV